MADPHRQLRRTGALLRGEPTFFGYPVNYTPFSTFSSAPKYVGAHSEAFLEGSKYSDFNAMAGGKKTNKSSSVPINKYSKQGLSSDVRHTLGSAAGKEAIIDWASSNLGIDPYGKVANVIGNVGITGATALEEIPDAWRSFKQALGEGDYGAITSGGILAQPWEDVQANLNAWGIPYGATLEQKKSYVPQLRFKQQQLMNRRKQDMQRQIREAEKKRIEQEKIKAAQDNWKPTYNPASSHAEARATGGDYHSGHESTVGGQTTDWGPNSAMIARGGLAQRAPRYANGGLIDFFRYGGFIG
jgi:hypothetical protein